MKPLFPGYKFFCQTCGTEIGEGEYLTKPAREEMERIKAGQEVYCKTCYVVVDGIDSEVRAFEAREKAEADKGIEERAKDLYVRLRDERLGVHKPVVTAKGGRKRSPGAIPNPGDMH